MWIIILRTWMLIVTNCRTLGRGYMDLLYSFILEVVNDSVTDLTISFLYLRLEWHVGLWILVCCYRLQYSLEMISLISDETKTSAECSFFLATGKAGKVRLVFEKKTSQNTRSWERRKKVWVFSCNDVMTKTQGKHPPGSQTVVNEQE